MLDGCTVGMTCKLLSLLQDARCLGRKSGMWCKCDPRCRNFSSPHVLNLVWRLLVHEVSGGCATWMLGRSVFVNQQNKLTQQIAETQVYISLLPAYIFFLFSSHIKHSATILNSLNIMRLGQNNDSRSKTPAITYTSLYIPSGLSSATCNCIIMLMPRM